ncbi:MAG: hypothetical protein FJ135_17895 [Deltaproteobacteria bacterium]|nr:hypothetical protein [Deltaproteobacteria bacterium]
MENHLRSSNPIVISVLRLAGLVPQSGPERRPLSPAGPDLGCAGAPGGPGVLDNPFRALEFFAVQVWLAGLFLAPVCVRRLIRYLGRKIKVES